MMNPDEGLVREITEKFSEQIARKQGFTAKFQIGEIVNIKEIYFEVLNFVEDYNTMNLRCIKTEEALKRLSAQTKESES